MKKVYEPGEAMYKACTVVTIGYAKPWALLGPHGKAAWAAGERMYNSMMVNVHPDEQTDDSSGLPAIADGLKRICPLASVGDVRLT